MNTKHTAIFTGLMAASLFSIPVSAATMSYYMDQSDTLADDQNYLMVTLADSISTPGALDVTVKTLDPLNNAAGENFGIQSFAFNALPAFQVTENASGFDISTQTISLTNLTGGWSLDTYQDVSEFGKFDIQLSGTGGTRSDTLSFTLSGVSQDTVDTYFASNVADFSINGKTSAFFAGDTLVDIEGGDNVAHTPIPATAWLLGSGLIGMVGIARRKRAVAS